MQRRDYYLWLTGTTADQFAQSMRSLVLPIIATSLTGSVAAAGGLEAAAKVLFVVLALFGGVVTDRLNRRTGIYLRASIGLVVWLLATVLLATGALSYSLLFVLVLVAVLSEALFGFADDAALRSIVTDDAQFASAQSVVQARRAIISLLGGPVGGLLFACASWLPFGVTAGALALLGVTVLLIKTDLAVRRQEAAGSAQPESSAEDAKLRGATVWSRVCRGVRGVCRDISEGFRLVYFDAVKRQIAFVAVFLGFSVGLVTSLVVYQLISEKYSAVQIALIEVSMAIGMLGGAPLSAVFLRRVPTGMLVAGALALMCADFVLLTFLPHYALLFLWFAIFGLCVPLISAPLLGYFYARTPQHLQGRSAAIMTVTETGLGSLAPLLAGVLVAGGLQQVGLAVGAALMALSVLLVCVSRRVRTIGLPETWADAAE